MDKRIGSVQNRVSFVNSQTEISGLVELTNGNSRTHVVDEWQGY